MLHHGPQHPQGSARVTKAPQRCAEGTGTRMKAKPWKGTHLLCPSPPRLGVAGCGRLPAHSLPCASAALLAREPRDGAKSPPLPSRSLPRGARLGRRPPRAWHPAGGAGSGGPAGSGTPPAICHPAAELQLATLRPQAGDPNGFLAKAAGKISEVWLFGLGVFHISLSKDSPFFPYFYISLEQFMWFRRFSATPVPEGGAAKSAGVPTQLMLLFCFFFIYYLHSSSIWRPQAGWGIVSVGSSAWPLNR